MTYAYDTTINMNPTFFTVVNGNKSYTRPSGWTKRRAGTRVEGWQQKIAGGISAMSEYTHQYTHIKKLEPVWSFAKANPSATPAYFMSTGVFLQGAIPLPAFDVEVQNEARRRFYKDIGDQVRRVNGGTILGELRETIKMLRHPVEAIGIHAIKSLKGMRKVAKKLNSDNVRLSSRLARLDDAWLGYSLGFAPFFSDVNSIIEELQRPLEQTFKAAGQAHLVTTSGFSERVGASPNQHKMTHSYTYLRKVRYFGGFRYRPDNIPATFGVTAQDLPSTMWNCLPLTFLVDYVLDVSTFLEQGMVSQVDYVYRGSSSLLRTNQRSNAMFDPDVMHELIAGGIYGKCDFERMSYTRSILPEWPRYVPSLHVPGVVGSLTRALNVSALLAKGIGGLQGDMKHWTRGH